SVLVFGNLYGGGMGILRQSYMLFPLLVWAALRFGQYGAATSVFVVSGLAIAGTAMGFGPFAGKALADSLFGLQTFMGVAAATVLPPRGGRLIGELWEAGGGAGGRRRVPRGRVDLLAVGREAFWGLGRPLADADCRVELQADGTLTGHWDPDRLDQVVDNLIS